MRWHLGIAAVGWVLAASVAAESATPSVMAPEIQSGMSLRARYGIGAPSSSTAIYVDSVSAHHVRTQFSTIAWRDPSGLWSISQVGEDGPGGLLPIEPTLIPEVVRRLTPSEGKRLDRLLASKSLYTESTRRTGKTGIGAVFHTMELSTPAGRRIVRWDGRLVGQAGRVADIILGKA
jgi:hypothetical protein